MTDDDRTIRSEYGDLINRLMRNVTADRPAPGATLQAEAEEAAERIRALTSPFDSGDLPAILLALRGLREHPGLRAEALGVLGHSAAQLPNDQGLACRAFSLAAGAAREAGDQEQCRKFARYLLELSPNDAWRDYAGALLGGLELDAASELEHPADCALFRDLSGPSRDAIAREARLWRMPTGSWLCVEDNPAEELWVLRTGRVAVLQRVGGEDTFLRFRRTGEVVGEMGALTPGRHRTASIVAVTPTEAWVIPYRALLEMSRKPEHADLAARLADQYFERRVESRLSQHALFQALDPAARAELAGMIDTGVVPRRFEAGDVLARGTESVTHLLLVLDGDIERHMGPSDARPVEIIRCTGRAAPLLGAESLLESARWPGDIVGAGSGWVAALPAARVRAFAERHPTVFSGLAQHLLAR